MIYRLLTYLKPYILKLLSNSILINLIFACDYCDIRPLSLFSNAKNVFSSSLGKNI